VNEAKTEID